MTPFFRLPHRWIRNPDEKLNAGFVQDNFEAVEQGVEQSLTPIPVVAALPTVPTDGQVIYYLADSTNGVVWTLKYRAAASGSYKWEFAGGGSLHANTNNDETVAAATITYVTLGTSITATIPLAGDYLIEQGARGYPWAVAQDLFVAADGCGLTAADADAVELNCANGLGNTASRIIKRTLTAATLTQKYRHSNNTATANFKDRFLTVTPVRVG